MRIRRVNLNGFRRFTDLEVDLSSVPASLVMLCGPNGSGKSSLFDAIRLAHDFQHGGWMHDDDYYLKAGVPPRHGPALNPSDVILEFEGVAGQAPRNAVYVRSAYRNDPEFSTSEIRRANSPLDGPRVSRMIENDVRVADNYNRLIGETLASLYSGTEDESSGREIRERLVGELRDAIMMVLPDLRLLGLGDPIAGGTFVFEKGSSTGFPYKALSGGEKAVFDILLDLVAKRPAYDDTVICIDEPETHTNPRVQGALLDAMLAVVPSTCQLWLASHSIGMLRRARDLQRDGNREVAFLDFDVDFDQPQVLRPIDVDRSFWSRTLAVAFGDMADLVAPERVILCEGTPRGRSRSEFDARCLRTIFGASKPATDFVGVGNDLEVIDDSHGVGRAIGTLSAGTTVERLIDRDGRSPQEVTELAEAGVRVLGRRHLESYLLSDEILRELCRTHGRSDVVDDLLAAKASAVAASASPPRNNPADDMKSCAGEIFNAASRLLQVAGLGNDKDAFMRDSLAPLVAPPTTTYAELEQDVFGAPS